MNYLIILILKILFKEAIDIENIHLPKRFWHKLKK